MDTCMTLLGTVYSPRQEQFAASPADIIAIALAPLSRPPPPLYPTEKRSPRSVLKRATRSQCHGGRGRKGVCRANYVRQDDNARGMHGAVLGGVQGRSRRSRDRSAISLCITFLVYHTPTNAGQLQRRSRLGSSCSALAPRVMCLAFDSGPV